MPETFPKVTRTCTILEYLRSTICKGLSPTVMEVVGKCSTWGNFLDMQTPGDSLGYVCTAGMHVNYTAIVTRERGGERERGGGGF